jgi:hypothetical protein
MGKTIGKIQWVVVALLWIYIAYRAFFFAITEDEAYSYFLLKTHYWRALPGTANTHWLNTFFMRLFMWLPGADLPYKFRIFSVSCWWVFAYSVIKLSGSFRNRWVGLAFFAAAILNPFLLSYFSLARGYAAGCAFAMLSLWQAARVLQKGEGRPAGWLAVFVPASVAVLANLSFFYFFMGVTAVCLFHLFFDGSRQGSLRHALTPGWKTWFVIGATFVFATGCLLFIKFHSRELEFVEYPDLVRSSFGSLVRNSLWYDASPGPALFLGTLLFIGLILFSLVSFYWYFRSRALDFAIYSMNVFVVILLLSIVFHVAFKTSFLYGRTALVLYVTILPGVFGIIDRGAWRPGGTGLVFRCTMGLLVVAFCFNFCKRFNTRYLYEWPVQADTQKCLDWLARSHAKNVGMGLWHRDVFIFYYALAYPGRYPFAYGLVTEKDLKNDPVARFDHLLLSVPSDGAIGDPGRWTTELSYPETQAIVLARRGEVK